MKICAFNELRRALSFTAALAVGAVWLVGCGGSKVMSSPGKSGAEAVSGETTVVPSPEKSGAEAASGKTEEFSDDRDGQTYKTVKMPGGKTWMAANLNFKTDESWCYLDEESNCQKYGRLYSWNTAKTVCPAGWHLPSKTEWAKIVAAAGGAKNGGTKLKSATGWDKDDSGPKSVPGTDDYGFSAMPGGGGDAIEGGNFYGVGAGGTWWTATENNENSFMKRAYYYSMSNSYNGVADGAAGQDDYRYSVRCVKDD